MINLVYISKYMVETKMELKPGLTVRVYQKIKELNLKEKKKKEFNILKA